MSIHERKKADGTVVYDVRYRAGGNNLSKTFYERDRAKAFDDDKNGVPAEIRAKRKPNLPWADYCTLWLGYYKEKLKRATSTVSRAQMELDKHIRDYGKKRNWTVAHVTLPDLQECVDARINRLTGEPASASAKVKTSSVLKAMMRDAVEMGFRADNPAVGMKTKNPKSKRTVQRLTNPQDAVTRVLALSEAIGEVTINVKGCPVPAAPQYGLLVETIAFSGQRPAEAVAMQEDVVDRRVGDLQVVRECVETDGRREIRIAEELGGSGLKSAAAVRPIPLIDPMIDTLDRLDALRAQARSPDDNPWYFHTSRRGRCYGGDWGTPGELTWMPMSLDYVRRFANKAAREIGWDGFELYDLRHIYASLLIRAGVDEFTLTTVMGHEDHNTTKRIYGHVFEDALSGARKAVNKMLSS